MKKYIKSVSEVDIDLSKEIEDLVLEEFGGYAPDTGCTFISPDGTFVNIYPQIRTHEDLCYWVEETLDIELDYCDEEYFIREYDWIRLRQYALEAYVELPQQAYTDQLHSLQEWLELCEVWGDLEMTVSVCDSSNFIKFNFGKELFSEDVMKLIRRFYASGNLYL